jgi:hypothetical protein
MRRLSHAGFKKEFVRPAILPDWWDDTCAEQPDLLPDIEICVARFLGISLAAVKDPGTALVATQYPNAQLRRVRDMESEAFFQNNNPTFVGWSIFDRRLYTHSHPLVEQEPTNTLGRECLAAKPEHNHPYDQTVSCYSEIARNFIREHPGTAIKLALARAIKFLMPAPVGVSWVHYVVLFLAWLSVVPATIAFLVSSRGHCRSWLIIATAAWWASHWPVRVLLAKLGISQTITEQAPSGKDAECGS